VFLALRFLPLVQREVRYGAGCARHPRAGGSFSLAHRFKLWQRYIFTILVNGLRKAEVTAISLECRAFGYSRQRTTLKDVYFKASDMILVVLTMLVSALLIYWEKR